MRKIGFYLNNPGLAHVDCSSILDSNPGIGGTEYMFYVICLLLSKTNKYQITLFVNEVPDGLPLDIIQVDCLNSAIKYAENEDYEILIFKHSSEYAKLRSIHYCCNGKLSLFVWTHNFTNRLELSYYNNIPNLKRIICVGRELRDVYLDHPCIRKMCYIYNTLNTSAEYKDRVLTHPYEKRGHVVVHIGSIVPGKGFHHLARIWKEILAEIPDAELYVIGSGTVYDRSEKMGRYGIARQDYEDWFMPYLTEDGKILPSVHFVGSLGREKEEYLYRAKVGIPNPESAVWGETFCLVAVEMQLCGVPVIAGKSPGYYDTFFNGKMVSLNRLKDAIVAQLRSNHPFLDFDTTYSLIVDNFSNAKVLSEWEKILDSDYNSLLAVPSDCRNWTYRAKFLKYVLSLVKNKCPLFDGILPFDNILQKLRY